MGLAWRNMGGFLGQDALLLPWLAESSTFLQIFRVPQTHCWS